MLFYATPTEDGVLVEDELSRAAHEAMDLYWKAAKAYAFARVYEGALNALGR
jgi:hypothetical protein